MKQATREWVKKAEADYEAATYLARRRKVPLHDAVCFHCQQCGEKYFKARLEDAGVRSPKTHDLLRLLALLLPLEPLWSALSPAAKFLTDFAVDFRYPGSEATKTDAKAALLHTKTIRREARLALGLKV